MVREQGHSRARAFGRIHLRRWGMWRLCCRDRDRDKDEISNSREWDMQDIKVVVVEDKDKGKDIEVRVKVRVVVGQVEVGGEVGEEVVVVIRRDIVGSK